MTELSVQERIRAHPLAADLGHPSGDQPIHAVGGIVRDALLGHDSTDLDLSVAEGGEQLARRIACYSGGTSIVLGGDRFSSYRVVAGVFQADIWDRRGGSLHSDLERRDLTINAIACFLGSGETGSCLVDPFGGLQDLAARTLRATKADCFERDPLRVLRLARFQLWLEGFELAAATAVAARAAAEGLEEVASERIREEMQRILESTSIAGAFETLRTLKVLEVLVPAAAPEAASRTLLDRARRLDRYLAALGSSRRPTPDGAQRGQDGADRRRAALAVLGFTAGSEDPDAGVAELGTRGLATRRALAAARRLLDEAVPANEPERRLFLDRHRQDWPLALAVTAAVAPAGAMSQRGVEAAAASLAMTARSAPGLVEGMPPLLDGHRAARILGMPAGPKLGEALRALARAQALGEVGSAAEAEDYLRELAGPPTSTKPADAD